MAGCSSTTSKICLLMIGFILWGAAATLIFLGSWVYHTYQHYSELTTASLTLVPAGIVIIVGVFLFVLGCIGCIAACNENKCLLAVFFAILLVVLTAEVTAGTTGYIFRHELNKAVHDGIHDAMDKYDVNGTIEKEQIDYLQSELQCCGLNKPSDWANATLWKRNHTGLVPDSCCNKTIQVCNPHIGNVDIYNHGCVDKLENQFRKNLSWIAAVAITFAIIQLLGMMCSCILLCRSHEVRYEILGGPNSGLRV